MSVNEFFANIKSAWLARSPANRSLMAAMFVGVLVFAAVAVFWLWRTDYQVLFTELDTRDGAAIVEELRRMKVPYKLVDGGTTILVEEGAVHETRLQLMGRGVALNGGVGFEIFDNKDIGMTEYTQRINYQRALQGELARTIVALNQVKQARVHLVVPEHSLFKRQAVKPKASVTLLLKPGKQLDNDQIVGIQRLVAASVPGLEAGAVMVLDQRGVTLSAAGGDDEDYAVASGKLRLKKNAEDYFVRKISDVLDRTFGPGQAIVSADVTLNFDEVKRTQQTIVPVGAQRDGEPGAVVRKRQSVYRQSKGQLTKTVNGDAYAASASPDLTSTTDVEYELGKSIEQVVSSPGGIRRISVGVIVPKLSSAQTQRVQEVISMVVGYNPERGDAITVQSIDQMLTAPEPSIASELPRAMAPTVSRPPAIWRQALARIQTNPMLLIAAVALFGVCLALTVVVAMRSRARRRVAAGGGLTNEQRRARLAEIKSWLDAERTKGLA